MKCKVRFYKKTKKIFLKKFENIFQEKMIFLEMIKNTKLLLLPVVFEKTDR